MAAFLLAAVPAHAQEEPQEAYPTDRMSAQEAHDASLIDDLSNVPELSIPLHELESKEDLIKTVREHFKRHTRHPIHVPDPHMSADVERVLEAIEAGDDDRLRETLSEIAGTEVRIPTGEFTPHGDAVPFDGQFLSTPEEALERLSPEHVEALAGLRHLLDDRTALLRALDDVSELEREAAMEYMSIRLMLHGMRQRPNVYPPEVRRNLEKAKVRGWYDASDRQAPGSHLLTLAELQTRNRADNVVPLAPASLAAAGFGEYIPETAASYSFTVPGQEERKEVIADTKFGGVLFVEKTKAGHVQPHDPNLHITGYDGSVRTVKYADAWVTIVTAFDGRHMYQLALEKKLLEGNPARDEFVRMAIAMIEDHLSKPLANEPEDF